jgi:glycosyltransferase involved in cell wall biosynthesis
VKPSRARRDDDPVRVVRIIARLNIGGPAIQAITLTRRLEDFGYQTVLVRGVEEPDEGNMDHLADELGVTPVLVPALRRNPGWHDLRALWELVRIIRRERPHLVHTHAAKGGTLGRVAALLAFPLRRRRPVLIHTYHGHSLTGYFSPRTAEVYRRIEQLLGRFTDRLIAVGDEVRDELVAMGVAPGSKFEVVPLGFDLSPFTVEDPLRGQMRDALRAELGVPPDAQVVTLIARLVPIKRVDRFLRVANVLGDLPDVRFLIVGDGELGESLHASADALALGDRLVWAGFRRDMPSVYFASDLVVQTSDNEGTPVSLIEAQAAGVPVVSTRVGGTESTVGDARLLAAVDDEPGLARLARSLLEDRQLASVSSATGRNRALARFDVARLVSDIDTAYRASLMDRAAAFTPW